MAAKAIEVRIWDQQVGAVAPDPQAGCYAFEYAPQWLRKGIELAPLTMPAMGSPSIFLFPSLSESSFKRLPGLLADALPDDFGNALIDRWLADRGVPRTAITPLDRLAYMGQRAIGALEFKPRRGPATRKPTAIELNELVGAARQALAGRWNDDEETAAREDEALARHEPQSCGDEGAERARLTGAEAEARDPDAERERDEIGA